MQQHLALTVLLALLFRLILQAQDLTAATSSWLPGVVEGGEEWWVISIINHDDYIYVSRELKYL